MAGSMKVEMSWDDEEKRRREKKGPLLEEGSGCFVSKG